MSKPSLKSSINRNNSELILLMLDLINNIDNYKRDHVEDKFKDIGKKALETYFNNDVLNWIEKEIDFWKVNE